MSGVFQILETIAANPSKNFKVDTIREALDNPTFARMVDIVFNPFHAPFNIKKTPELIKYHSGEITLMEFFDELPKFQNRVVSGHAAADYLEQLLSKLMYEDAEVARRVIKKDLRAGFSGSSVNKAKRGTIPTYGCLLAVGQNEDNLAKMQYPAYSQLKSDGMRANHIINYEQVTTRGRSGKEVHLEGAFDFLSEFDDGIVTDGEFVLANDDGTFMSRKKGNGILNKAIRGKISPEEIARIRYVVWDLIPIDEFMRIDKRAPAGAETYLTRWDKLTEWVKKVNDPRIILAENRIVNSEEEALEHFQDALDRGEEGTILKNTCHPWENYRSGHLIKFKVIAECDLLITDWSYGAKGFKYEHTVGTINGWSGDKKVRAKCSGLSDDQREDILNNFDAEWKGNIMAVLYNERITDKNRPEYDKLFLPRFLERREDKDTADNSGDIK